MICWLRQLSDLRPDSYLDPKNMDRIATEIWNTMPSFDVIANDFNDLASQLGA